MRRTIASLAICLALSVAPFAGEAPDGTSDTLSAAIVVRDEDPQMRTALACLEAIEQSPHNEGETVLVRVLDATGFSLTKVTAKAFRDDPSRIRFGFEFANRQTVKTVYWEADCPTDAEAGRIAAR